MTVTHLFPPIAAATIVNAILFALMWRGHQAERAKGKDPWWLGLGLAGYCLCAAAFAYAQGQAPARGYLTLFGAALFGEAFGVVVTFVLVQAFVVMRGRPWRERAFPAIASVAFTLALFIGFFTGR
ncbi:hypothetical protein FV230_01280 [Methylobacterium sp. WL6]|nr:hypothetical protein FV230_01280 [Methylobacterium sp. WL6]